MKAKPHMAKYVRSVVPSGGVRHVDGFGAAGPEKAGFVQCLVNESVERLVPRKRQVATVEPMHTRPVPVFPKRFDVLGRHDPVRIAREYVAAPMGNLRR